MSKFPIPARGAAFRADEAKRQIPILYTWTELANLTRRMRV